MGRSRTSTDRPPSRLRPPTMPRGLPLRRAQHGGGTGARPTRPAGHRPTSIDGYRLTVVLNEASPWSWHIVEMLSQLGIEVVAVHVRGADGPRYGARTADIQLTGSTAGTAIRLRSVLVRSGSDAVLCLYSGRYAFIAALATLFDTRCDLFLFVGGSDATNDFGARPFGWVFRRIRIWSYRRADIILTHGDHLRAVVLGIDEHLSPQVWLHGIATPALVERCAEPTLITLFAPRVWKSVYNNEQLLGALELLDAEECEEIEVVINGLHMPDSIRRRVAVLAEKISIRVLDGYDFNDRYRYFTEATHVVSMARSDGVPNAVLEAAYAGCRLILGDIAATRELVRSRGLRARLVPLDSPEDLARALRECRWDRSDVNGDAIHNRRIVDRFYGPECAKQEFSRILLTHLNDQSWDLLGGKEQL